MYLVEHGRLERRPRTETSQKTIGFMRTGDIFGERSLVTGEALRRDRRAGHRSTAARTRSRSLPRCRQPVPAFARRVNEEAAGRNYLEEARVPLDFAKEILPGAIGEAPWWDHRNRTCPPRAPRASGGVGARGTFLSYARSTSPTAVSLAWP